MTTNFFDPSPLDAALEACQRGWFVFPLVPGKKTPLLPWRDKSSKLTSQIQKWAAEYPDCNWGLDCGKSGLIVLDIDMKHGHDGQTSLHLLETANAPLPETFTVTTTSGGWHRYLAATGARGYHGFVDGLDLQSNGQYVVLYGSVVDGKAYWVSNSMPVATCPQWLRSVAREALPPRPVSTLTCIVELDREDYIQWAIQWLHNEAPESIQGRSGDDTLYKVFCKLRDGGISEAKTVELIEEHYNDDKSSPPWQHHELVAKAKNAFKYARGEQGAQTDQGREALAAKVFGVVDGATLAALPASPFVEAEKFDVESLTFPWIRMKDVVEKDIEPIDWILGTRLIRGCVTGTIAAGGVGKSLLTFVEALSILTGKDFCGEPVHEQGPVIMFNAEDAANVLQMRFAAVARHFNIDYHDLDGKKYPELWMMTGDAMKIRVASLSTDRRSFVSDDSAVQTIRRMIRDTGAIVFVGDPLIAMHDVAENDNVAMNRVAEAFKEIAKLDDISVHLVHHTRKRGETGGEGDAESGRGASSFIDALRVAHTLSTMSENDAKRFGIDPEARSRYVRLDDAKINLSVHAEGVRWYFKESVLIDNGEQVGALKRVKLEVIKTESTTPGRPFEVDRAIALVAPGTERLVSALAKLIADTTADETRDPHAIYMSILRYFRKNDGRVTADDGTLAELIERERASVIRVLPTAFS